MKIIGTKTVTAKVAKQEGDDNSYRVTFAHTDTPDKEGDVFRAYESEKDHLFGHDWNHASSRPIYYGKMYMEGNDVIHDVKFYTSPEAQAVKEIWDSEAGDSVEFSYRFYVPDGASYSIIENNDFWWSTFDYELVKVFETSPVSLPATENTGQERKDMDYRKDLAKGLEPPTDPEDGKTLTETEPEPKSELTDDLELSYSIAKARHEYAKARHDAIMESLLA